MAKGENIPLVSKGRKPMSKKWQIRIVTIATILLLIIVIMTMAYWSKDSKNTLVKIKQGRVKGSIEYLRNGDTYISFKGIPYAKPPLGNLRYKAPEPPDNWTDIKHAFEFGNMCMQYGVKKVKGIRGSEDCLFLNVFTPSVDQSGLAVMVWIHGGAFMTGKSSSPKWGPRYLVEQGVIVVTANYRQDTLGFLSLGTKDIPGNAGLKDQVAVLEWVRDNIEQFGGDPNKVTFFGSSSGAICVSFHMLSPMSKNLFRNIILHSGTFVNDCCFNGNGTDLAFQFGKLLGQDTQDVNELEAFFKTEPAENLVGQIYRLMTEEEVIRGHKILYTPVLEKEFDGQEAFISKFPMEILQEGNFNNVPLITGYTDAEGLQMLRHININNITVKQIIDSLHSRIPFSIEKAATKDVQADIVKDVKSFYFANFTNLDGALTGLTNLESDVTFDYHSARFASLVPKLMNDPVYMYRFSFDGKNNHAKKSNGMASRKGACHGDDLFYIFESSDVIENGTIEDAVSRRLLRMWTNFAKFNDPVPELDDLIHVKWKPFDGTHVNFLNIDRKLTIEKSYPEEERFKFWDNIYGSIFESSEEPHVYS